LTFTIVPFVALVLPPNTAPAPRRVQHPIWAPLRRFEAKQRRPRNLTDHLPKRIISNRREVAGEESAVKATIKPCS